MNAVERVEQIKREIDVRKTELRNAIKEAWPEGSTIQWIKNSRHPPQIGLVVQHGYDDQLLVRNGRTDKTLWITTYDVYCARDYASQETGGGVS